MEEVNLTNQFLIAMPAMEDPNFARTLTYICEHNEQGALGVIVNRPIDMTLAHLFERVGLTMESAELGNQPVYYGGPVQPERGFVLHRPLGAWQATMVVTHEMGLTSSRDVLQAMSDDGHPEETLITLGYASWAAGQLEWELAQNAWLTVEADPQIIFGLPSEERLAAAMQSLGVDFTNLSEVAGHA